jgi:class 3 adenylate cyclase/tetratricopeptide (TPR) repeat protein
MAKTPNTGLSCPRCAFRNPENARFCGGCGFELPARPVAVSTLPDERKVVTAVFADLVGFTSRAERLDPEDVRAVLTRFHAPIREEFERFGGTVEKIIGDAVLGLFGAPVGREDDSERAVRAALAVCDRVAALNAEEPELDLHVRVGVATGEALVTVEARPETGVGMAAGDVLNTAARLQAAAPVDGVLVTAETYRATRDVIDYRAAEPVEAKGKSEPVAVWEAVRAADPAADERPHEDAPLVGRDAELESLALALARAREDRALQLVLIVGEPGIGKSRLVYELARLVDAEPETIGWCRGRSVPYASGSSFAALAEIVKAEAGITERDTAEEREQKLADTVSRLAADAGEARWVSRHLRPLAGLAGESGAAERAGETFAAWRRFFEALAGERPTVLVFEDLHWADEGLLDFIEHLVQWADRVPLLVVVTARPELFDSRPGWGRSDKAATMPLRPLSDEETDLLLGQLLEDVAVPDEAGRALVARTGGNPLYVVEYVRMLADRGRDEARAELPLPESVQAVIAARIDRLAPDEKAIVQDAAVVGKVFWASAVAALEGVSPASIEDRLRDLERREFVRRERISALGAERQYAFRHVLVRDVAYGQIPRASRSEKHERAAEWIESLAAGRSQAELRAHHYLSALELARAARRELDGLEQRALEAAVDAGEHAASLGASAAAVRFYRSALDLVEDPDPELVFAYGMARVHAQGEGADELAAARDAFLARGEGERAAEAEMALAGLLTNRGERLTALGHLERAAAIVADADTSPSKAHVLASFARFRRLSGEHEEAVRLSRQALAMAEELGLEELQADASNNLGISRFATGDAGGIDDLERSIALASKLNSQEAIRGLRFLAAAHGLRGELPRSYELYAEAGTLAARFGDAYNTRSLVAAAVFEHYWKGSWEAAVRTTDEFITASGADPHFHEIPCRRIRGLVRLARGDTTGAEEDSVRGLAFARVAGDPWFLNPAIAFRARVLVETGSPAEADALADEVLSAWSTTGLFPSYEAADLAVVLLELDRSSELEAAAPASSSRTRWFEAARLYAAAEFAAAADRYAEIGAGPEEAFARLRAAAQSSPGGRGDRNVQLARGLAFFRSVGASAYVDYGTSLSAGR